MSSTVPTIKVVNPASPGGFTIINESDRQPHHEIWNDDGDTFHKAIGDVRQKLMTPIGDVHADVGAKPQSNEPADKQEPRPVFNLNASGGKKNR